MTHSLWKIKFDEDAVSGHNYTFINKETGYALTFDHTRAVQLTAADAAAAVRNTEATIWMVAMTCGLGIQMMTTVILVLTIIWFILITIEQKESWQWL